MSLELTRADRILHHMSVKRKWSGISKGRMRKILKKQGRKCYYCGVRIYPKAANLLPVATVDHVIPLSRGGNNSKETLVASCSPCNQAKGDMSADDFLNK